MRGLAGSAGLAIGWARDRFLRMSRRSTKLLKAALSALHYTGADGLLSHFTSGNGVIFMLHSVTPDAPQDFEPNRILKITPQFLETARKLV